MYGRDLDPEGEDFVSEERFEKIRYYLKHGTYPSGADRAEKSRLRSAATHYKLIQDENGQGERLMLKDKEVVSDPQRQYEIARDVHASQHGGINKTTATIAERFHWVRIKETVSLAIKNCRDCKESTGKAPTVRPIGYNTDGTSIQMRRAASGNGQNVDPNSMIERLVNFDQMEPNNTNAPKPSYPAHSCTPVPNMQSLQNYSDIPLDPQITGHHPSTQSNHRSHPPSSPQAAPLSHINSIDHSHYGNLGFHDSQHTKHEEQAHDTRMATERHVREGDEPMAFQDERGMEGEVTMVDGVRAGRGSEDVDLEELLNRG